MDKLDKEGLGRVWNRVLQMIKLFTGDVDYKNKGTLQQQIDSKRLLNSTTATEAGKFAADAVQLNKAVPGSYAAGVEEEISLINSGLAKMNIGNGTITITQNGVVKGSFTVNQSNNVTIALTDNNTQAITGVKGNAESTYRTGNVNLTPANIGALPKQFNLNTGDLNNTTAPGIYTVAMSGGVAHCPESSGWGCMLVYNLDFNPKYTFQQLTSCNTNKMYVRGCENGTWRAWASV